MMSLAARESVAGGPQQASPPPTAAAVFFFARMHLTLTRRAQVTASDVVILPWIPHYVKRFN